MRDFSSMYMIDGTAAIDGSTCVNTRYRRSESLGNVVQFPGLRSSSLPNPELHTRENTNKYVYESEDARERLNARIQRVNATQGAYEGGVFDYVRYFTDTVEMMAESVRGGSIAGSRGPVSSRTECVVGTSLMSALCFAVALL